MTQDFYTLMREENIHHMFLNETGIINAMKKSYTQGTEDVLIWLSEQTHLCDNVQYLIEEWNNQNK